MSQVTITINSREYAIACDKGEEVHILQLSKILDEKAKLLTSGGAHINENMLLAMVGLLLADELSELKKSINDSPSALGQERAKTQRNQIDLSDIDEALAEKLENYVERINLLAKSLEMM